MCAFATLEQPNSEMKFFGNLMKSLFFLFLLLLLLYCHTIEKLKYAAAAEAAVKNAWSCLARDECLL